MTNKVDTEPVTTFNMWRVHNGMPTYVRDNVYFVATKQEAIECLKYDVESYRDGWPDHVKSGNANHGWMYLDAVKGGPDFIFEFDLEIVTVYRFEDGSGYTAEIDGFWVTTDEASNLTEAKQILRDTLICEMNKEENRCNCNHK